MRTPVPEAMAKAQQLSTKATLAQTKVQAEKDAEKRKELIKELNEAEQGGEREDPRPAPRGDRQARRHPVRVRRRHQPAPHVRADEADGRRGRKAGEGDSEAGRAYGPLLTGVAIAPVMDSLAAQGMEALALSAIEPSAKALPRTTRRARGSRS